MTTALEGAAVLDVMHLHDRYERLRYYGAVYRALILLANDL
jgi:hypothetical protein